jgi:hypothetical protein
VRRPDRQLRLRLVAENDGSSYRTVRGLIDPNFESTGPVHVFTE